VPAESQASPSPRKKERVFSITLSPLHLLLPIVELTAELRAVPHFGVALIAGYGSIHVDSTDPETLDSQRVAVTELGGQLLAYPLESFESLQLGAEVLWLHAFLDDAQFGSGTVSASASGVAVGPLIGYKYLARGGFTFIAQGGAGYLVAHANARNSYGDTADDDAKQFIPILNLQLGWSF
jgi:hypothetical protein